MRFHFFFLVVFLILQILTAFGTTAKPKKPKVPERGFISSKPAKTWEEGLICGNGTIGVNIMSHPLNETIIFSHERLFLPKGAPTVPPDNSHMLFEIRNLIDRGLYKQASELAFDLSGQESFMYPDPFVPAFDVNLQMESEGEVNGYMRSVDFQTGEATVHWSDDRGVFERKMFVSRADGLAVLLITGPKGALDFKLGINPRKPSDKLDSRTISRSYQVFESHISDIVKTVDDKSITYKNSFTKAYPGSIHALEGVAKVVLNDGKLFEGRQSIKIEGAGQLLILIDLVKAVVNQREFKTEEEIIELTNAVDISVDMHVAAMRFAKPGMTEAQVTAEIHKVALAAGGNISFPIIATKNSQTLHNHYHGNTINEGDLFLIDAGFENQMSYAGDLSSTIPVSKKFTPEQKKIYQLTLDAHQAAIDALGPGIPFRDAHLAACITIFDGLKAMGFTRGNTSDAFEAGAHALFFPCGTGHPTAMRCLMVKQHTERFLLIPGIQPIKAGIGYQICYVTFNLFLFAHFYKIGIVIISLSRQNVPVIKSGWGRFPDATFRSLPFGIQLFAAISGKFPGSMVKTCPGCSGFANRNDFNPNCVLLGLPS